ncbi:MAG: acetyl-CoA carboxylase biotin carboxylase subunit [Spirochaetaceae bacterium]|nr:acetyl-CoA carboxylase biotin carboxylase subunit [Spirochaetaceae bacterium]MCF7948963.1 acetyl-CoA carboxylase biotin carboxylase subunit [Spirochaetia bacterium]MCF7950970.1 acetyl-CoA carboxylase biotin carboxylase subunit [Spirochaetaceae bacterium]
MVKSVFIANRGEIAVRIVRTLKEMGIEAVVGYSEADRVSLAVELADKAVCIGPAEAKKSYLHSANLISAALYADCDAIHPGVGFLSESAEFAKQVQDAGLVFIGPDAKTISFLGDKVQARRTALDAGLPVTPGSDGPIADLETAVAFAERAGYPVIIKAASGGGGKGMRIVREESELESAMRIATHEAETSFSDGTIYIEKYLENPRHIEVQILADTYGNVIHLGERDCSLQKNHQKVLEESPSPGIDPDIRERMCSDAVNLFKKIGYKGAGTIEFLFDGENYYFMEVNARVQVEHPVSEYISNVDIIKEQIRGCSGEPMDITQDDVLLEGASIECRINASTPGKITRYLQPGGRNVRVDSFLYQGYTVSPHYDSLVSKLITYGRDRRSAIARMKRALDEYVIEGIETNIEVQKKILNSTLFQRGIFGTFGLSRILEE